MQIRKATLKDAKQIAPLLFQAMDTILYAFIARKDAVAALNFLEFHLASENNQYSYQNCYVIEKENKIVAAANLYDGALLLDLRKPIETYIHTHYNPQFSPEDETQTGEVYLDTIGVDQKIQGQGLGSILLRYLIDEIVIKQNKTLGLLVESDNPKAKKLYQKLGFKAIGTKRLAKKTLDHMQINAL